VEPVTPHLHKKSKGNLGTPSLSSGGSLIHQSSPQHKTSSNKKRVNIHSPYRIPVRLPESSGGQLWSDEGSRSSSSSSGVLVVGEDTSDEDSEEDQEPLSLILTSRQDLLVHKRHTVACGGRCYSFFLAKGQVSLTAASRNSGSGLKGALDNSSSSGLLSDVDMSPFSETEAKKEVSTSVDLVTLFGAQQSAGTLLPTKEETDILDGVWPGLHDTTLLIHFVSCHFDGDWLAYSRFLHWADTQLLDCPGAEIQLDKWLSLKSSEAEDGEESGGESERHHGEGAVCNQLCNKTVLATKPLLLSLGAGSPPTGWPTDRIPSGRLASGQPDIRLMFQAIRTRTPIKLAAEKVMEVDISLQESEEALHLDRVEALRVKFFQSHRN
jgi:hypothetical protein